LLHLLQRARVGTRFGADCGHGLLGHLEQGVLHGREIGIARHHQIGALLTAVGSLRRIIVPMNVSLVPSSTREARANAPEERILTAQFDIQTYVSKTGTEGDR